MEEREKSGPYQAHDGDTLTPALAKKICVTGMHRSGTSLVAMWLNRCGVAFAQDQLLGARPFNRKGHYEDTRLAALHSLVIKRRLPKSKGWIVTRDREFTFDKEYEGIAREIISSYNKSYSTWGWKDPRMSMVLKTWKKLIPDLKMVSVWRPADAVVASLVKRSFGTASRDARLGILEAIQSWKIYNKKILEYCELFPDDTLLMPLDEIIRKDVEAIQLIRARFDVNLKILPISEVYDDQLLTTSKSNFLSVFPGIAETTRQLQKYSSVF